MNAEAQWDFVNLIPRQQRHRVRGSAMRSLDRFGVEVVDLRPINHDFNATYRVRTADGADLALRINLNSPYDLDWLDSVPLLPSL